VAGATAGAAAGVAVAGATAGLFSANTQIANIITKRKIRFTMFSLQKIKV
jgi:hypothetical protein